MLVTLINRFIKGGRIKCLYSVTTTPNLLQPTKPNSNKMTATQLIMDTVSLAQESNLSTLKDLISQIPEIKHSSVKWMNLSGIPSVFINVSLDDKNSWVNGIFQNSRFAQFAIHDDMKIEQIAGRGKSRKTAVKSFESITNQLTKWSSSLIN